MKQLNRYFLILILFLAQNVLAQEHIISGTILDENGFPFIDVLVEVEGTEISTFTDENGSFELNIPVEQAQNANLNVSYIGYESQLIPINDQTQIEIALNKGNVALEEMVVVGYGSQERGKITGAVSTIDGENFENRANTQLGNLLQGQSAGVEVVNSSGKPSAGFNIRIRGTTSIGANSEPLYVVDGVPTTDTRSINPADIESISVLKDAASSAIYGAAGANGVVLITTKMGQSGKPKINFDAYTGISQIRRTLPVLNGEQYRDLMQEMGQNTNWDLYNESTDWQQLIFQDGISQNYQVAASGKTDLTNYYVSGGYVKQKGVVRSSEMERANFKVNFDQEITDWLKFGTRITYTFYTDVDVNDSSPLNNGGVLLAALATPSIIGVYNEDGTFTSNPFQNWENPISRTDGLDRLYKLQKFLGNAYLEAEIFDGFTYRTNFGIDMGDDIYNSFLDPFRTSYGQALEGQAIENRAKTTYHIWDNILRYEKRFNQHNVELMGGTVIQKTLNESSSIETRGFSSASISTPNGGSTIQSAGASKWEMSNTSFISRLNYDFADRYLLTANFRADGSSKFGPNTKWGYFPSVSVGWRISKESFMQNQNFFQDLKLRAGWGLLGVDAISSPYAWQALVGAGANYPIGGVIQPGNYPATLANESLKWEESEQSNIGLDATFFNRKITLTADAYIKTTHDLLLNAPLPNSTGFTSAIRNIGEIENKGIEISLNTTNISTENLLWQSKFNFSLNRNEVLKLADENDLFLGGIAGRGESVLVTVGQPVGLLYGYVFGGVDPATGNAYYLDQNGNSTFTPTAEDRRIIGDANPDFLYSFNNHVSFKGFELNVFFQGSYGNDILNATRIELEGMTDPRNQFTSVLNRWRQPGDITNIPRASWGSTDNSRISSRFVEDGSYLRVKSLTLGYNFPVNWISSMGLSTLKLYVTGENLFTWTNYSGYDPEVNTFGGTTVQRGVDYGTYPQTRNIIFGVNVSL